MSLETYLNSLPWGGKKKLSEFLNISQVTVTKYSKNKFDAQKLYPTPEKAKLIEIFSKQNAQWGIINLEEILGKERADQLIKIWGENDA